MLVFTPYILQQPLPHLPEKITIIHQYEWNEVMS